MRKESSIYQTGDQRRRPAQHEGTEQELLFRWTEYMAGQFPEIKLLHHIPNGGKRNKSEAAKLKRQGVKAGVPDLFLPVARCGFHGLYIEMKYDKNKPTQKQNDWIEALRKEGYAVVIAYGWGEASEVITKYFKKELKAYENKETD